MFSNIYAVEIYATCVEVFDLCFNQLDKNIYVSTDSTKNGYVSRPTGLKLAMFRPNRPKKNVFDSV